MQGKQDTYANLTYDAGKGWNAQMGQALEAEIDRYLNHGWWNGRIAIDEQDALEIVDIAIVDGKPHATLNALNGRPDFSQHSFGVLWI